jgi:sugar lactone lactonase YvrE
MINHRFTDIMAHLKESISHPRNLKMLLLFGLLTFVLISGVIVVVAAAEKSPQKQKEPPSSLAYSNNIKLAELLAKTTAAVNFDPKKGQLPEGLVVNNKDIFVAWAPIGQVAKIDKNNLTVSKYGSWPTIPPNKGFMLGLNLDKQGNLYAAVASLSPELKSGVYRLPPGGAGQATLFATHPNMTFPNDLLFDKQGRLFVSDSSSGTLFTVQPNGKVAKWISDPLLNGDRNFCPPAQLPVNIGANGIALDKNGTSLFVVNTDRASIIRVPIMKDGSAGKPELFVGPDCKILNGADGIVLDKDGSFIVAVNKLNKIVRVAMDKKLAVLESGGILDFPASLKIDDGTIGQQQQQQRILYITNFGFISAGKHLTPRVALLKAGLGSSGG